jgi:hypothetical protein
MADTSVFCDTCDRSPKWAHHGQCFGCLFDHVKPCDVVPKLATDTDLAVALAEIARYRAQWEQAHPGWELVPDYQRIWPESAAPSRHADYATTIGRKLVHARWKVERRHPKGLVLRFPVARWYAALGPVARYYVEAGYRLCWESPAAEQTQRIPCDLSGGLHHADQ